MLWIERKAQARMQARIGRRSTALLRLRQADGQAPGPAAGSEGALLWGLPLARSPPRVGSLACCGPATDASAGGGAACAARGLLEVPASHGAGRLRLALDLDGGRHAGSGPDERPTIGRSWRLVALAAAGHSMRLADSSGQRPRRCACWPGRAAALLLRSCGSTRFRWPTPSWRSTAAADRPGGPQHRCGSGPRPEWVALTG